MAIRERVKDNWIAKNRMFWPISQALNRAAKWCNGFDARPPLIVTGVGYGVHLTFEPWETPFTHPWRAYSSETSGKINVRGGTVNDGYSLNVVTALSNETPSDGWKCWLRVKHYYDTTVASEYVLVTGTGAWPTDTHNSTAMEVIQKAAEIDGTTLYQYLYEDQFIPRINPPLPSTSNVWFLTAINGVIQWVQSGTC